MIPIYIDCTDTIKDDKNTGIQRVVRNLIDKGILNQKKLGICCQAVCFDRFYGFIKVPGCKLSDLRKSVGYLHSIRQYLHQFWHVRQLLKAVFPIPWLHSNSNNRIKLFYWLFLLPLLALSLPAVGLSLIYTSFIPPRNRWYPQKDEIFIIPGASWWNFHYKHALKELNSRQCRLAIIIHDLIPLSHSEYCSKNSFLFTKLLPLILSQSSIIITNSKTTLANVNSYLTNNKILPRPTTKYFHLGADLDLIDPSKKLRQTLQAFYNPFEAVYLCVGTIEPRKNHVFLLNAFDEIWKTNPDIRLCIAGKYGWNSTAVIKQIRTHPYYEKKLIWFDDLDDTELSFCYAHSKALILPSIVEGFGLPLVEALLNNCPVLASDIPIFREIGGDNCLYFSLDSSNDLVNILSTVENSDSGNKKLLKNCVFNWNSWQESTMDFYSIIRKHFIDQ